ncbi:MAG: glycerate kinase [Pirellula sp.]
MSRLTTASDDALRIWTAGVDAVRADRVVQQNVHWDGRWLSIAGQPLDLADIDRLILVGAGKATAGMLRGVLNVLGALSHSRTRLTGWINIPEGALEQDDEAVARQHGITLCQARPQGVNEPTPKVVEGTQAILRCVEQAGPRDAVLALISGGGSALLCMPARGIDLATKLAITRRMSAAGAGIEALNAVRRCMSQVKGGGLVRRCRAAQMVTLILSDVLGDPIEMIASGPTVLEPAPDFHRATELLQSYFPGEFPELLGMWQMAMERGGLTDANTTALAPCPVRHYVLANNATAVAAAQQMASQLGYRLEACPMGLMPQAENSAAARGEALADGVMAMRGEQQPIAIIAGGEPTVVLPDATQRGRGGRNQQLVLAAGCRWLAEQSSRAARDVRREPMPDWAILSGGTDGEDGPTDAAGAWIDADWIASVEPREMECRTALASCDAYTLFQSTGHLIRTGPTHTNVCDLWVGLRRA